MGHCCSIQIFWSGAVVPWAKAGVGAIATQSFANTAFGPKGLELLEDGLTPKQVVEKLLGNDPDRELRQFAVINQHGETAAFTGKECYDWAGDREGKYCSAQGNILVSKETVNTLIIAFEKTKDSLSERLIEALV